MHISDKLSKIIKDFDIDIFNKISIIDIDIDYLDLSKNNPYKISFIHKSRIKNIDDVWSKNRYILKPGKLLKKIIPNLSNKKIEKFSNHYKGAIDNIKNNYDFKIINGNELKKYYHYSYYYKMTGSLEKSCMKYDHSQNLLDIYISNNIKMLILLKDNKLLGRTLLWETEQDIKIMDRIYSINEKIDSIFYKWATKNNYYRKKTNKWNDTINFITPNNEDVQLLLSIKLKTIPNIYPYLDTFKWLNINEKKLFNYKIKNNNDYFSNGYTNEYLSIPGIDIPNIKVLIKTDGKYYKNDILSFDDINNVYDYSSKIIKCKYLKKHTNIDNVVFSNIYNDYILKKDVNILNDKYIIYKDDKFNDFKKILKFILNDVQKLYYDNILTDYDFNQSKMIFKYFETKIKK